MNFLVIAIYFLKNKLINRYSIHIFNKIMKTIITITFLFFTNFTLAGATIISIKTAINKCSQEYHPKDCLGI